MSGLMGLRRLFVVACSLAVIFRADVALADDFVFEPDRAEIRVGIDEGDIRGNDHRALQAAVDYVAGLGGGTVRIGPGRYEMRNALKLRDNVRVFGSRDKTILVACDGFASRLAADGDANEREITVEDASGFRLGDGVAIDDRDKGGFEVTTATLAAQTGANSFRLSAPLYLDYMVSKKATARLAFPVIGGWNVKNALVAGVIIEGNREKAEPLNGCRGGGIYLFECEKVSIIGCTVRNYRGDGISFQVSQRVTVEDCLSENHEGLGIHPGSGSQYPVVLRCRSIGNGGDGLYVCWRVKHGQFQENEIRGNQKAGISIGHKDTDNVFFNNEIVGNSFTGILFRNEAEAMGAHRNEFVDNRILDNGGERGSKSAAILIEGHHHDLVFRNNTIGNSQAGGKTAIGVVASEGAKNLKADKNEFVNVEKQIEGGK
jgi:hypothetical protein